MSAIETDCAIVGAGPAGLAAARAAIDGGVRSVLVIDRDDAPGGLPRFCRHPGFGWEYTRRLETGPGLVRRLIGALDPARVQIRTGTTVQALHAGPRLEILSSGAGAATVHAKAVILATGIRERPRTARLVPGRRPERGILTTGQLQQMIARGVPLHGKRLVVVGTEHVAFSVLLTARHAGLSVVAMVEAEDRPMSYAPVATLVRCIAGVPIHASTRISDIHGEACVSGVEIESPEGRRVIPCDAVVFSGDFVPDSPLARSAGLTLDPATGGPQVDQIGRTSAPCVFAAGNLLRAVESSGFAAIEGARVGAATAAFLGGRIGWRGQVSTIAIAPQFRYVVPQCWSFEVPGLATLPTSLRVGADLDSARVGLRHDQALLWRGPVRRLLRHRRIRVPLSSLSTRLPGSISLVATPRDHP